MEYVQRNSPFITLDHSHKRSEPYFADPSEFTVCCVRRVKWIWCL